MYSTPFRRDFTDGSAHACDGHIDPDSLPPPNEVALEIVENLELALAKFRKVALELAQGAVGTVG
jgi:hypothetical protein